MPLVFTPGVSLDTCKDPATLIERLCDDDPKTLPAQEIDCAYFGNGTCQGGKCLPGAGSSCPKEDKDQDCIADGKDNCPSHYNPAQADKDADGRGDACDNCPSVKNPGQEDADQDGKGNACDDLDFDKDGAPCTDEVDCPDNCPGTPNPDQQDSDGDGIGDVCEPAPDENKPGGGGDGGGWPGGGGGGGDDCDTATKNVAVPSMTTLNLYAAAGGPAWRWVAGEGGNIFRRFGDQGWEGMLSPWDVSGVKFIKAITAEERAITALWSPDGTTLLAATAAGYLFRWDGSTWAQWGPTGMNDGKYFGAALYAVHGTNAGNVWIAGAKGAIWNYGRGKWQSMMAVKSEPSATGAEKVTPLSPSATWRGLYSAPNGTIWVVGDGGIVLRRKAPTWKAAWEAIPSSTTNDLRTVWADTQGAWVGGEGGTIWCGEAALKNCGALDPASTILQIAGVDADNLYAVGTQGLVVRRFGNDWQPMTLPVANSVTAVWSHPYATIAVGVNGTVYDLTTGVAVPTVLLQQQVAHPEWAATRWTAHQGWMGDFWVVGDDLAVARRGEGQWTLLHSDAAVVPFTAKPTPARDLRDLYRDGDGTLWAVGNIGAVLRGTDDGMDWGAIALPPNGTLAPDFRSVRPGGDGDPIVAGNWGLFAIKGTQVTSLFPTALKGPAVALYHNGRIWLATHDGAYTLNEGGWSGQVWPGVVLEPTDIQAVGDAVVVIGREQKKVPTKLPPWLLSSPKFGTVAAVTPGHYLYSNGAAWLDVPLLESMHGRALLGLHPFSETVELPFVDDLHLNGMVALGGQGLVAAQIGFWILMNTGSVEDWYDGTYTFDYDWDLGWFEVTYWMDVNILGVGGHNAISKTHWHRECTTDF
ncbi:MAG: thrombospondin type 3 repeat-containing protein [Deltaproteobacteria bacterium]|nr:thrombospondin type 3 repeat-containing protein [Deltaproteobacteria bacterium]